MLHRLFYTHPILLKNGLGIIHICANRITGRVNSAKFYPEGYEKTEVDITHVDFEEFFLFHDPVAAVNWAEQENGQEGRF